jgi:hypothetical protein
VRGAALRRFVTLRPASLAYFKSEAAAADYAAGDQAKAKGVVLLHQVRVTIDMANRQAPHHTRAVGWLAGWLATTTLAPWGPGPGPVHCSPRPLDSNIG